MLRALVKLILIVIVVAAVAAFFLGYRWGGGSARSASETASRPATAVGTSGEAATARERAREAGADIGGKVAVGAQRASESIDEVGLTAKVKSKIALDDTLDGSRIRVSTNDNRVTLTGTVVNQAQHTRALALARETDGVAAVVDQLSIGTR